MTVQDDEDETESETRSSTHEVTVSPTASDRGSLSLSSNASKKKPPGPPPGRPKSQSHAHATTPSQSLQLSPHEDQRSMSEVSRTQSVPAPSGPTHGSSYLVGSNAQSALLGSTTSSHGADTEEREFSGVFSQLSPSTVGDNRRGGSRVPEGPLASPTSGSTTMLMSPTSIGSFNSASSASRSHSNAQSAPHGNNGGGGHGSGGPLLGNASQELSSTSSARASSSTGIAASALAADSKSASATLRAPVFRDAATS